MNRSPEERESTDAPRTVSWGLVFLSATIVAIVVAELIAVIHAGFEDQGAFMLWTVPLAAMSSASAIALNRALPSKNLLILLIAGLLLGVACGVLYTLLVGSLLGPWIGAFGMPVLLCWVAAAVASSLVVPVLAQVRPPQRIAIAVAAMTGVVVVAMLLSSMVSSMQTQVRVVVFRHDSQGPDRQLVSYEDEEVLSPAEKEQLFSIVGQGQLTMVGGVTSGSGRMLRVVLVLHAPVGSEQTFKLPQTGTIFVVQKDQGWIQVPPPPKDSDWRLVVSERQVEMPEGSWEATTYMVYRPDGSGTGADAIHWKDVASGR